MENKGYSIVYGDGGALVVKDQPHRTTDTARTVQDVTEYEPTTVGQVTVIGGFEDTEPGEVVEMQSEELDTICVG